MPVLETKGALSAQIYGLPNQQNYIEDVFSTYLYTGNSATGGTQTITNNIALYGLVGTTQYTGTGLGFSVNSNDNWGYVALSGTSPIRVYRQNDFNSSITLSGTSPSPSNGASISDSSGNTYAAVSYSTAGVRYMQVLKLNSAGDTVLWSRRLRDGGADGFVNDIATDGTNVYIVGQTNNPTGYYAVVVSISCSTGAINWNQALTGSADAYGYCIALDSSSNVYVGGLFFEPGGGLASAFIRKLNSSGTTLSQTAFTNIDTRVKSIAVDTDGSIYVGGTNSSQTYFVSKLNSALAIQWTRTFSPSINQASWIDVGVGSSTFSAVFTDATLNVTYVVTLDKSGNFLTSSSAPGHLSLGTVAGSNRKPIYKNGKLYLLLDKVYVANESAINNTSSILTGSGIPVASTSVSWTIVGNPGTTTWGYTTDTPSLTISKSSYTPSGTIVAAILGKGGMVWIKSRTQTTNNVLFDTARGAGTTAANNQALSSNLVNAEDLAGSYDFLSSFNTNGFTVTQGGSTTATRGTNYINYLYAAWTFRKQPKFFDVVTYTGDSVAGRTVPHNLGSVPGCIIVKCLTPSGVAWQVYHRSLGNNQYLVLNTTAAAGTSAFRWNNTTPTASVFTLGSLAEVNGSGFPYVAYLFAHDAGGFGASGTDNVISCGSYTGNGSATGPTISLGYEPQWLLIKRTDTTSDWNLIDNMRGFVVGGTDLELNPNLSNAESSGTFVTPTATGFQLNTTDAGYNANTGTYIYIAIRRGPMKTPTAGTSVFVADRFSDSNTNAGTLNVTDATISKWAYYNNSTLAYTVGGNYVVDRLRGGSKVLATNLTDSEGTGGTSPTGSITDYVTGFARQSGFTTAAPGGGFDMFTWSFRRAPGFFDVVCYTGNGDNTNGITISHNLGVAPQVIICKRRSAVADWYTSWAPILGYGTNNEGYLNTTSSFINGGKLANAPTATTFKWTDASGLINASGSTYVAYLFATVAGVSKVGSYTGTGTTNQINCGFTGGARFVLIKRTDSTGDWYVWDSARGIVAGNDPYLLLNSTAAEVTGTDYVDTYSLGFEISSTAPAAINANGGTFIFWAIA